MTPVKLKRPRECEALNLSNEPISDVFGRSDLRECYASPPRLATGLGLYCFDLILIEFDGDLTL
jgi:hypothetical protein